MLRGTGFRVCPDDESVVDGNVTTQGPLLRNYVRGINFGSLAECSEVKTSSVTSALKISLCPPKLMVMYRWYGNSMLIVSSGMWQGTLEIQNTLQFHVLVYACQTVNFYGIPDL